MALELFLGPISKTYITNHSKHPIHAFVKMSSRITVTLKIIVKDEGVTFLVGAERREMNVPDGFTRIESGKKISFYPEGGTHRLGKAETAYLSIYIELPGGVWKCCCQNHPFKENRSFTVTADNTFFENPY